MSRSKSLHLNLAPLYCTLLLLAIVCLAPARAQGSLDVQVTADPPRVNYRDDQPNRVTIRVVVRDETGRPVPNQTPVRFVTDLGLITQQAYTQNGQVVAQMENTEGPGRATVEIFVEGHRRVIVIEFLGVGQSATIAPKTRTRYHMKAKQIQYSVEKQIFELMTDARFTTQTYTVTADRMQFNAQTNLLTAQDNVTVTAGEQSFTTKMLRFEVAAKSGAIVDVEPEVLFKTVDLATMETKVDEKARAYSFTRQSMERTRTWILCKEATVYPDERQMQFRRPGFYLDGSTFCFLRLPYHVLNIGESRSHAFLNSDISVTSDAGLNVDFPVYYSANATHIGSLHFRHVAKGSSFYRGESGVQVSLEEEYLVGQTGDGALFLDDLTRPTRSASWEHRQEFGKTRVNLNASLDRYSADDPYAKRATFGVSQPVGRFGVSLSGNWNEYDGTEGRYSQLSVSAPSIPIGNTGVGLNFNPYVGWSETLVGAKPQSVEYPRGRPASVHTDNHVGLRSSLDVKPISFLGGEISPNISDDISRDSAGVVTNFFDAGIRYRRHLFGSFRGSLGYSFGLRTTSEDDEPRDPTQNLTADLSGGNTVWSLYAYSSFNPQNKALFSSASFEYLLPFDKSRRGDRRWFLRYDGNLVSTRRDGGSADHTITLGRSFNGFSAQLHYSPSGDTAITGFGTGSGKQWAFELVRDGW